MNRRIFYSEFLKEKFIKEMRRAGHSIEMVEKDFVGVWTVFYRN